MLKKTWCYVLLLGCSALFSDDAVEENQQLALAAFHKFNEVQAARGQFKESTTNAEGKVINRSSGEFHFLRPNYFRWQTQGPAALLLQSDGKNLYTIDFELKQVVMRELKGLENMPTLLLLSHKDWKKSFHLQNNYCFQKVCWIELRPKQADTGVEDLALGLKEDGQLLVIQWRDTSGYSYKLNFHRVDRRYHPSIESFQFSLPTGFELLESRTFPNNQFSFGELAQSVRATES